MKTSTFRLPKIKNIPWLIKYIEDIYDSLYIYGENSAQTSVDYFLHGERESTELIFPLFLYNFIYNKYGLTDLCDNDCLDILDTCELYRGQFSYIEIFSRCIEVKM